VVERSDDRVSQNTPPTSLSPSVSRWYVR
jgi:hypothetical protein